MCLHAHVSAAGFRLPYVCGDMAREELNGFMAGYNGTTAAEYMSRLETLLLQKEWSMRHSVAAAAAALAALAQFLLLFAAYLWDINHTCHTVARYCKLHQFASAIRWLLYKAMQFLVRCTSIWAVYEAVNVLCVLLNTPVLVLHNGGCLPISPFTPARIQAALAQRLAASFSQSVWASAPVLTGALASRGGQASGFGTAVVRKLGCCQQRVYQQTYPTHASCGKPRCPLPCGGAWCWALILRMAVPHWKALSVRCNQSLVHTC